MLKKTLLDQLNYNKEFSEPELLEMLEFIDSEEQLFNISNISIALNNPKVFAPDALANLIGKAVPLYIINNKPFSLAFISTESLQAIFGDEYSGESIDGLEVTAIVADSALQHFQLTVDADGYVTLEYQEPVPPEEPGRGLKAANITNSNINSNILNVDLKIHVHLVNPEALEE